MSHHLGTAVLRVAHDDSGPADGRPLVAVHRWADDLHRWDGDLPHLRQAGYRVYRPRLGGFGEIRFRDPARPRSGRIGALGRDPADFVEALDLGAVAPGGP